MLPERVPAETTKLALTEVHNQFEQLNRSWSYKLRRFFDIVDSPLHRHSFPLEITQGIEGVLRHVLAGADANLFTELCGDDGVLVELSALLTFPGAKAQAIHTDIPFNALPEDKVEGIPPLCSVFVALQDITREMGPTMILRGTHKRHFHRTIKATQESYDSSGNLEVLIVATGSSQDSDETLRESEPPTFSEEQMYDAALICGGGLTYVMDTRCAHAGGANQSASSRAVLCFSFQKDTKPLEKARGFTYHLRHDLQREKLRLSDFR